MRLDSRLAPVLGAVGLVAIVAATFLPWLHTGLDTRNSYQAGGAVRRLLDTSGLVDDLLALWPALPLACAAAIALYLVGLRSVAAAWAAICALAAGSGAIAALAAPVSSVARVDPLGPICALTGATLVLLAVLLHALGAVAASRSRR